MSVEIFADPPPIQGGAVGRYRLGCHGPDYSIHAPVPSSFASPRTSSERFAASLYSSGIGAGNEGGTNVRDVAQTGRWAGRRNQRRRRHAAERTQSTEDGR